MSDFVRVCAVEMHMDMSSEPFCVEIDGENGRGHLRGRRFLQTCAAEMHGHVTRAILRANLQGKCRPPLPRQLFCPSLRSQNAHGRVALFLCNFKGKMTETNLAATVLCDPGSRNPYGHFTKAIWSGNLRGKCRTRRIPPRLNIGPLQLP